MFRQIVTLSTKMHWHIEEKKTSTLPSSSTFRMRTYVDLYIERWSSQNLILRGFLENV
jgi:hypothetical protein